jgi:hypothetical protein
MTLLPERNSAKPEPRIYVSGEPMPGSVLITNYPQTASEARLQNKAGHRNFNNITLSASNEGLSRAAAAAPC